VTLATVLGNLLFDLREDRGLERARAFVNVRDLFRDGVLRPLDDDDSAAIVGLKTKRTTTTTTSEKGDYKLTVADDRSMGKRSPPASDSRQILVADVLRCELTSEFVQILRKRRARHAPTLRIVAG